VGKSSELTELAACPGVSGQQPVPRRRAIGLSRRYNKPLLAQLRKPIKDKAALTRAERPLWPAVWLAEPPTKGGKVSSSRRG